MPESAAVDRAASPVRVLRSRTSGRALASRRRSPPNTRFGSRHAPLPPKLKCYVPWKYDGSATGFYLAELVCPHSYYDKDEYCAIEFRCYLDDSDPSDPKAFSFTLHDDC